MTSQRANLQRDQTNTTLLEKLQNSGVYIVVPLKWTEKVTERDWCALG